MEEKSSANPPHLQYFGRPPGLVLISAYKALWGLTELAVGTVLIFSRRLVTGELAEDPQDLFLNWLLARVHVDYHAAAAAGFVLLALGAIKLVLAAGIWSRSRRFRQAALMFFAATALYGAYHLSVRFSMTAAFDLLADLLILLYLWKFLPRHLPERETKP